MKIEIDINEKYTETGVKICAPALTKDVENVIAMMRMINMQIGVKKGDETYLLDADRILYIEVVDRKTFRNY